MRTWSFSGAGALPVVERATKQPSKSTSGLIVVGDGSVGWVGVVMMRESVLWSLMVV
jgi:hypothetical protein